MSLITRVGDSKLCSFLSKILRHSTVAVMMMLMMMMMMDPGPNPPPPLGLNPKYCGLVFVDKATHMVFQVFIVVLLVNQDQTF